MYGGSGIDAALEEIRQAAKVGASLASDIAAMPMDRVLTGISTSAMPGSKAAGIVDQVGGALGGRLSCWSAAVEDHARQLNATADEYEFTDDLLRDYFTRLDHELGGR